MAIRQRRNQVIQPTELNKTTMEAINVKILQVNDRLFLPPRQQLFQNH